MLRFGKAIIFPSILESNLLVTWSIKTCGSEGSIISEFINRVSIAHISIDFITLLYTFLWFLLIDTKNKQFAWS